MQNQEIRARGGHGVRDYHGPRLKASHLLEPGSALTSSLPGRDVEFLRNQGWQENAATTTILNLEIVCSCVQAEGSRLALRHRWQNREKNSMSNMHL